MKRRLPCFFLRCGEKNDLRLSDAPDENLSNSAAAIKIGNILGQTNERFDDAHNKRRGRLARRDSARHRERPLGSRRKV